MIRKRTGRTCPKNDVRESADYNPRATPKTTWHKNSRNEVLPEKTCSVNRVKAIVIFTEIKF